MVGLSVRIACSGGTAEHANAPHPLVLLRARRKRPRYGCAAEHGDELAPPHSITSSARTSKLVGILSARNGHAAAPPTNPMNSRRLMSGLPQSPAAPSACV